MPDLFESIDSDANKASEYSSLFSSFVRETIPVKPRSKKSTLSTFSDISSENDIDEFFANLSNSEYQQTMQLKNVDLSKYSEPGNSAEEWSFLFENDTIVYNEHNNTKSVFPDINSSENTPVPNTPVYKTLFSSKSKQFTGNKANKLSFESQTPTLFNKKSNLQLLGFSRSSLSRDMHRTPTLQNLKIGIYLLNLAHFYNSFDLNSLFFT
ncbi:hypothetical protein BB561_000859 [Smittium simulii]|uniref:Uncharacterized protein n=1 Tax=Smittium simulii TaxID=133385 RepID=A0A2T9YXB6_9FUNG|nr:hypothetical protein BB561_000859 [Smittium simulii]